MSMDIIHIHTYEYIHIYVCICIYLSQGTASQIPGPCGPCLPLFLRGLRDHTNTRLLHTGPIEALRQPAFPEAMVLWDRYGMRSSGPLFVSFSERSPTFRFGPNSCGRGLHNRITARISATSKIPQEDIGTYSGLRTALKSSSNSSGPCMHNRCVTRSNPRSPIFHASPARIPVQARKLLCNPYSTAKTMTNPETN